MTFTVTLGWWLVPSGMTLGYLLAAIAVSNWLAGGDQSGAGLIMFPATAVALLLSLLTWSAYLFWFA